MMVHFGLAFAFYCERQYDSAIEHAARAVDIYPDYWLVHFVMGLALSQKGSLHESIASLAERDPYLTRMDAEPYFEPFRSDPRYRSLLVAMNLDS